MVLIPFAERLAQRALTARGVQSRFVETSVARQHLYDAPGTGPLPTMVVIHGISSSALGFAPVIERLRRKARRVIVPEMPGHGFSSDPQVPLTVELLMESMTELLDRELTEPAILCGNSLGGAVSLRYALERPERVRGLVLTSPAGAIMEAAEMEALLAGFKMRSRADGVAFLARLNGRRSWYLPLLAPDVVRQFSREVIRSLTGAVRADHAFTPEQLSELKMPILLLWGTADQLLPTSSLAYFRRHLPAHAQIEEPALGHCPHLDDPRWLSHRIVTFAREVVAASGEGEAGGDAGGMAAPAKRAG
ncbi:alpha/beta fold hydrolase [Chondromyces apiculatus]|uniref:Hydrolase, alpha/beta fold family, putative n=1 Tax=Chondromyces apiculatus DSM 436 TaxID=1192034 RepID=A0A017THQ4_9BACT|nr:alpha/beta hydrolase [Chondromyces apiculatus]EYF08813.1 hydrolase, alpha/beta fold family, putative [Chondromyces apiculatus DSM 436]